MLKRALAMVWDDLLGFKAELKHRWPKFLLFLLGVTPLFALAFYFDAEMLSVYHAARPSGLRAFAQFLSTAGDFPYFIWIGSFVFWGILKIRKVAAPGRAVRRLIVVTILAGLAVNVFRFGVGRPRPMANLPDGIYGPSLDYRYHGTPSGHSTVVGAMAAMTVTVCPVSGLFFVPVALGVGWSRIELHRHHFADVALGLLFGSVFGLLMALYHRRQSVKHTQT